MSQPDDIDKLLREIDAMKAPAVSGGASTPATRGGTVAPSAKQSTSGSGGGRVAWAGASAIGAGLLGGLAGLLLPVLPTLSTGFGAALGGAAVALLSRPPRWFDSE